MKKHETVEPVKEGKNEDLDLESFLQEIADDDVSAIVCRRC